jgi:hypothetical protein
MNCHRFYLARPKTSEATRQKFIQGEEQPRFIPMNVRKAGKVTHHRMSRDQLAGPLDTVYDKAVIRTANGEEGSHHMRPVARSGRRSLKLV